MWVYRLFKLEEFCFYSQLFFQNNHIMFAIRGEEKTEIHYHLVELKATLHMFAGNYCSYLILFFNLL